MTNTFMNVRSLLDVGEGLPMRVLICGGESSGKTQVLRITTEVYAASFDCIVASNHKEMYTTSRHKENLTFCYKPKGLSDAHEVFNGDATVYLIDEKCDDIDLICEAYPDKYLVFVRALDPTADFSVPEFDMFDAILISHKDKKGNIFIDRVLKNK